MNGTGPGSSPERLVVAERALHLPLELTRGAEAGLPLQLAQMEIQSAIPIAVAPINYGRHRRSRDRQRSLETATAISK